jgi:hypothetical protein
MFLCNVVRQKLLLWQRFAPIVFQVEARNALNSLGC